MGGAGGTSITQAIDYFCTGTHRVTGLTLQQTLQAIDAKAIVADNLPPFRTQSLVNIGRSSPASADSTHGTDIYAVMGAQRITEDFELNGYLQCEQPGPSQKPARDAAAALWDGFAGWLHGDPTLNLILQQGRIAQFSSVQFYQTSDDEDAAGGALRIAGFQFSIHIQNHYVPN